MFHNLNLLFLNKLKVFLPGLTPLLPLFWHARDNCWCQLYYMLCVLMVSLLPSNAKECQSAAQPAETSTSELGASLLLGSLPVVYIVCAGNVVPGTQSRGDGWWDCGIVGRIKTYFFNIRTVSVSSIAYISRYFCALSARHLPHTISILRFL